MIFSKEQIGFNIEHFTMKINQLWFSLLSTVTLLLVFQIQKNVVRMSQFSEIQESLGTNTLILRHHTSHIFGF